MKQIIEPGRDFRLQTGPRYITYAEYLHEQLHKERIIFFSGLVTDRSAAELIQEILVFQSQAPDRDINLYVDSPGGDALAMLPIYDTMQYVNCDVATYCVGKAFSAASFLLAGGAKGKRFALPHSRVMIHQARGQLYGQATDVQIQAEESLRIDKLLTEILATHTGRSVEQVRQDTRRDRWMSAQEAKEYGIVDEIIETVPRKPPSR
jgi:ATP-dependent Clp protease protease subunit